MRQIMTDREGEALVLNPSNGYYNRSCSMEQERVTVLLKRLYDTPDALLVPSGMNAICMALRTTCAMSARNYQDNINIIYSSELYSDTPRLLQYYEAYADQCRVELFTIPPTNNSAIIDEFELVSGGQHNILFVESCSNPNGYVFDFSIIPRLRAISEVNDGRLTVIVDNTWLSASIFNPLKHGADIVVCSCTKYYSGGTAIGGAIMSNDVPFLMATDDYLRICGVHVSPHNAGLIATGIEGQVERVTRSSAITVQVVSALKEAGICISHPSLENHPSYELARRFFNKTGSDTLYPSVFTVTVSCLSKSAASKILSKCPDLEYKTSFGSAVSRVDPWPQFDAGKVTFRIAVGYNDNATRLTSAVSDLVDRFSSD